MTKFALIIAIPEYDNFKPLPKTTQDGETIAQQLRTYGDYQITRLPQKRNAEKADYEMKAGKVTVNQLYDTLKLFLNEIAKNQTALIYFTGHGFTCDRFDEQEGFLAASNTQVTVENNKIIEQKNGFPLTRLASLIQEANLSELVMLLDCCHSGNYIEKHLMNDSLKTFEHKQNYYLITACRSYETAKSIRKEEHSVFSGAVIEGLSSQNANEQGKISCDRLFDYINTQIGGKLQSPLRMGIGGSITLVKHSFTGTEEVPEIQPILDAKGEIVCPYQGLLAFTKTERPFFFGRKQVVEELERKLTRQSFIPLIGASGSGKSSVVLAGLIPWLEELGWQVIEPIKPGFKPLARLEQVLHQNYFSEEEQLLDKCIHDQSSEGLKPLLERLRERFPQGRHLLVVDQFEELFTVAEAEQCDRFIYLITQVTELPNSPLAVVTTMRADFLEPCLDYEPLRQLIEEEAKYLPTLAGKNLIDAICEPAKRQGYQVTEELLYKIRDDIKQEPGFLPLLEFALTQLWDKGDRAKHQLTLEGYEAIGGMVGALNRHADKVFQYRDYEQDSPQEKRSETEKGLIKGIFLKLLQIGEGEKDTRLRQPKAAILSLAGDNPEEQKLLTELIEGKQGLVKGRLLVTGGSEPEREAWVDLAHEALIEGWEKLKQWRTENREGRRLARQMEKDAQTWQAHDKFRDYLWGGYKLAEAEQVLSEYAVIEPLSKLAQQFLEACSKQELRSYLLFSDVDNLNHKALEEAAAVKSFLTKKRLWKLLEGVSEEVKVRLGASWLLKQWGEEVPIRLAKIDGEGKISLHIVEPPPTVIENLGNGIILEMVKIPGGEFWMGSPEGEEGSYNDERPRHKVRVSPFLMGKYPVTQAQWRAIASLPEVERDLNSDPSYYKGDNRPVEQVSWYDAVEFCQRLSQKTGKEYRLPSEAEWEYACRAGTTTSYHFGQTIAPSLANYIQAQRGRTTTVGRFQVVNAFGLYDLHGNVWEWCEDGWHDSYQDAPTDGSVWSSGNGSKKVVRGGSWFFIPGSCRSATRNDSTRDNRLSDIGFRVVCVVPRAT